MSESLNTAVVKDAYAAFQRGDVAAILAALDEHVEWQAVIGTEPVVPTSGLRKGRNEVAGFFTQLAETMDFEAFEPREFIAQDDQVACVGYYKVRIKSTGTQVSSTWVMVFTLNAGRITRFREWTDSAQLVRAFGVPVEG